MVPVVISHVGTSHNRATIDLNANCSVPTVALLRAGDRSIIVGRLLNLSHAWSDANAEGKYYRGVYSPGEYESDQGRAEEYSRLAKVLRRKGKNLSPDILKSKQGSF